MCSMTGCWQWLFLSPAPLQLCPCQRQQNAESIPFVDHSSVCTPPCPRTGHSSNCVPASKESVAGHKQCMAERCPSASLAIRGLLSPRPLSLCQLYCPQSWDEAESWVSSSWIINNLQMSGSQPS